MKKRIEELINFFRKKDNLEEAREDPVPSLKKLGYSGEDIEIAKRIADEESQMEPGFYIDRTAFNRVFSESEKLRLSVDAQGYLFYLISRNLISEPQLGLIIESIGLEHRSPASLKEIKNVIASYVSGLEDYLEGDDPPDREKLN